MRAAPSGRNRMLTHSGSAAARCRLGKAYVRITGVEGPGRLRYIMALLSRGSLQFHSFDQDYLQRLASGDAIIEHHFSSYFGDLLSLKLRVRIRSPQLIED